MTYIEWLKKHGEPKPQTAREILEARLGKALGPIETMPRDLRTALYLLAKRMVKR